MELTFDFANPTPARAVHPANEKFPIEVTFECANSTLARVLHPMNAWLLIELMPEFPKSMDTGRVMHASNNMHGPHPLGTLSAMYQRQTSGTEVTLSGMTTLPSLLGSIQHIAPVPDPELNFGNSAPSSALSGTASANSEGGLVGAGVGEAAGSEVGLDVKIVALSATVGTMAVVRRPTSSRRRPKNKKYRDRGEDVLLFCGWAKMGMH